jgi:hypothetical protein
MHTSHPAPVFSRLTTDIPAIHAGFLVVAAIVAALCNSGAFLLVVIVSAIARLFPPRRQPIGERMYRAARAALTDLALLVIALDASVLLPAHPSFIPGGPALALWTVAAGLMVLIPKFLIFERFFRVVLPPQKERDGKVTLGPIFALFVLTVGVVLLLLAPSFAVTRGRPLLLLLRGQLLPWKV